MVITDDAGIFQANFFCLSDHEETLLREFLSYSESVSAPSPRLCVLKREEGESYGFHLRVEKGHHGHIIRNVVSGGVAACSGLHDGDRLLEVNNYFVDVVSHFEVR